MVVSSVNEPDNTLNLCFDTMPTLYCACVRAYMCLCVCVVCVCVCVQVCCSWGGSTKLNGPSNAFVAGVTLVLNLQLLTLVHLTDFVQNRAPFTYDLSYALSWASLQVPVGFEPSATDPDNVAANITAKALALQENVALGIAITPVSYTHSPSPRDRG